MSASHKKGPVLQKSSTIGTVLKRQNPDWLSQLSHRRLPQNDPYGFYPSVPTFVLMRPDKASLALIEVENHIRKLKRKGNHSAELRVHYVKFLQLVDTLLWHSSLLDHRSEAIVDIVEALQLAAAQKSHSLFDNNAPTTHRGHSRRSDIEAHAAVVLDVADGCGENLQSWLRKIVNALTKNEMLRAGTSSRPAAPYSLDAVRKWRAACLAGKHPSSAFFDVFRKWASHPEETFTDFCEHLERRKI